jgi:flagellar M-ring protein FliF
MNIFGTEKIPRSLMVGIGAIFLGLVACAWWLLRSGDVVIFDSLEAQQLDAVSAELDGAGINFKVDREAGSIAVPAEQEQRARVAVMSSGNAFRNSVGFELFNGSDFGMTDFAQKINYQRAIEGELARTLGALDEIKYARVHLVLPEHGLFAKPSREPRAALTIFAEAGMTLTADQIRGLQRIAAAAVPELKESNVSVTDESGRILSTTAANDDGDAAVGGRLAQKQAVERYLADKVRSVLTRALGAEHFAVSVDVALDFTRKSTKTERVLDAGAGTGVKRLKETSRGEGSDAGSSDKSKEIEYSLGHEVEQVDHAAGATRRIQVGVIIDRDIHNVDIAQLRELIASAVGIDSERGDRVTVVQHGVAVQRVIEQVERANALPPATPPIDAAPSAPAIKYLQWGWPLFVLLAVIGSALLVRRTFARRKDVRLQQLRHRLQNWIEAEQVEVERT